MTLKLGPHGPLRTPFTHSHTHTVGQWKHWGTNELPLSIIRFFILCFWYGDHLLHWCMCVCVCVRTCAYVTEYWNICECFLCAKECKWPHLYVCVCVFCIACSCVDPCSQRWQAGHDDMSMKNVGLNVKDGDTDKHMEGGGVGETQRTPWINLYMSYCFKAGDAEKASSLAFH